MRRGAVAAGATLLTMVACQPVDAPIPEAEEADPSPTAAPVGATDTAMPEDLPELFERTDPEGQRWQGGARVAEVEIDLREDPGEEGDGGGARWAGARVTYVAADADRFLVVTVVDDEEPALDTVRLDSLGLPTLPASAVADLPDPEGLPRPEELAAEAAVHYEGCDVDGETRSVRLVSGAPATWEGDGWAAPPQWRAVVAGDGGDAVALDAATGEPTDEPCVAAPPDPEEQSDLDPDADPELDPDVDPDPPAD